MDFITCPSSEKSNVFVFFFIDPHEYDIIYIPICISKQFTLVRTLNIALMNEKDHLAICMVIIVWQLGSDLDQWLVNSNVPFASVIQLQMYHLQVFPCKCFHLQVFSQFPWEVFHQVSLLKDPAL